MRLSAVKKQKKGWERRKRGGTRGWEKGGVRQRREELVGDGKRGVGERVGGKRECISIILGAKARHYKSGLCIGMHA